MTKKARIAAISLFSVITLVLTLAWYQNTSDSDTGSEIDPRTRLHLSIGQALEAWDYTVMDFRVWGRSNFPAIPARATATGMKIPFEEIQVGDFVRYYDSPLDITHQVIRITDKGLVVQGYNNPDTDKTLVTPLNYACVVIAINGRPFGRFADNLD